MAHSLPPKKTNVTGVRSVTVIGSGIIGLTTASSLQEVGFHVRLISKDRFDQTLSHKVGAIWFPFEVHPKEKTNVWATLAYNKYEQQVGLAEGLSFIPFLTSYTPESNTEWTGLLPKGTVRKAQKAELPQGIERAYITKVPLAEPHYYMAYLFEKYLSNGGSFELGEISSLKQMSELDEMVLNCTGLGAKQLCNDEDLHPMRGQILRCKKMNVLSFAESTKRGGLSYIIDRSEDAIVGGTDYENDWNEDAELADTYLILNRLKETGIQQSPEILEVMVGLRPRRSSVRFEFDSIYKNIFHNYGHGGAGFTIGWGCAIELTELLSNH
ncbi:MAG: FAD-dependent oxidoreductase [Cyclobacteriaceae bacterium]